MNFGIIIQARLGSTRMPNKIFYKVFEEQNILDIIYKKLEVLNIPIVFAIPNTSGNDELNDYLVEKKYLVKRGDEHNVLARMLNTAKKHQLDFVVRVCSDNLFLETDFIKNLILQTEITDDYVSYYFKDATPTILSHQGFYAEIVKTATLEQVLNTTNDKLYIEHVTNYIHRNPSHFAIKKLALPLELEKRQNNLRLTIDTKEDFEIAQNIYKQLKPKDGYQKILEIVDKNEAFQDSMKQRINKYIK